MENYSECVKFYRKLLKNQSDEFQSTRQANYIAALAAWKLTDTSNNIQWVNDIGNDSLTKNFLNLLISIRIQMI